MGPGSRSLRSLVRDDVDVATDSIFKQPKQFQIRVRDPAARGARVVHGFFRPQRAWGMPGAQCTRSLACEMEVSTRASSPKVHRNHPAFPHAMVLTAYFVLSPATNSSCHRHRRIKVLSKPGRADSPPPT